MLSVYSKRVSIYYFPVMRRLDEDLPSSWSRLMQLDNGMRRLALSLAKTRSTRGAGVLPLNPWVLYSSLDPAAGA